MTTTQQLNECVERIAKLAVNSILGALNCPPDNECHVDCVEQRNATENEIRQVILADPFLQQLVKDKERLDWVEWHPKNLAIYNDYESPDDWLIDRSGVHFYGETLRTAIDAAKEQEKK